MTEQPYKDRIRNPEQFFRSIYENASDAIFLMENEIFIDCNRKTEEIFGCDRDSILQQSPIDFSPAVQPDGIASAEKAKGYIRAALSGTPQFFEWQHQRSDGTIFDAEVSLTRADEQEIILLAMVRDISRRKHAEQELQQAHDDLESRIERRTAELQKTNELLEQEINQSRKAMEALSLSEQRYREFLERFNSIVLEMNTEGVITYMNPYGRHFFGYKRSEIVGKNVMGSIVPTIGGSGEDLKQLIQQIIRNPEEYFSSENENVRKDGSKVWIAWTNRVILNPVEDRTEILSIGVDRTEQKNAQERLAEEIQERAASSERNRLARDLHDAVSQTLFSASLIAEVLPKLWDKDQEEARRRLEEVRRLSRSALAEMRTLLFELRPKALIEAETSDLLRQLIDMVTVRSHIPITLSTEGDINLPPEVKIAFYRITQEALNNVSKHSEASEASVALLCKSNGAVLDIRDNGVGFDSEERLPDSLGIGIMTERAETIGADIQILSNKESGTEIKVLWNNETTEETVK